MTSTEAGGSIGASRRGQWFGPSSFVAAVIIMFVNIVPVAILPLLVILGAVLYGVEVVVAVVLCAVGGRSRQVGAGIAVAVGTTAVLIAVALMITFVRENL